jgi:F-box protein 25/32
VEFKQDLAAPSLVNSLPEECIREILLRLSDASDVEMAGRACATMNTIAREKRVWRELVQTHFSKQQVSICSSKYLAIFTC